MIVALRISTAFFFLQVILSTVRYFFPFFYSQNICIARNAGTFDESSKALFLSIFQHLQDFCGHSFHTSTREYRIAFAARSVCLMQWKYLFLMLKCIPWNGDAKGLSNLNQMHAHAASSSEHHFHSFSFPRIASNVPLLEKEELS